MSFFMTNGHCFICGLELGARPGATQLPYARREDVGDDAGNGRDYVHRACWESWAKREAWARSSTEIFESATEPPVVGRAGNVVVVRRQPGELDLNDYWQPVRVMVPDTQRAALIEALEGHEAFDLEWQRAVWHIGAGERPHVEQTWGEKLVERFTIERVEDWIAALRRVP